MGKKLPYQVWIALGDRPWQFAACYHDKNKAELVAAAYRAMKGAVHGEPFKAEVREREEVAS